MNFQLSVSTQVLREKSDEISSGIVCIRNEWNEIQRIVSNSKYYWQGKSEDKHLELLQKMSDNTETIIKRLAEHPKDLLQMAGVYEHSEQSITENTSSLPSDVIV